MNMLRFAVLWGCMLSVVSSVVIQSWAQTTYYVAVNGKDANDGKSVVTPFQSLSKVSSLQLVPGDAVLFRRGDTFRGTLTIRQAGTVNAPIRIDAYGTGQRPTLSGSLPLTGWVQTGTNKWQAPCPDCGSRVTGLFANNIALPLGRYPNPQEADAGFLTVQGHVGNNQLTSRQALTTNWVGAEVVVRPTHWIIDRATITGQRSNTLSLTNPSNYALTDGWGYFIQNHPATLDQDGEWYYDPAKKVILLYQSRTDPNGQSVTATVFDDGVVLTDVSNISIQNVQIMQTRSHHLYGSNVSGLTLTNVNLINAGEDGITLVGTGQNVSISQVRMTNVNNNGINVGQYQNVTLRNNTLRTIGLNPGRGKSGDGQFCAVQSLGQDVLIENNVIDSVGYNGLSIWNNTTVRRNSISNFCAIKSDGGGIYLWNGNKLPMSNIALQQNVIWGGIGTTSGTSDTVFSGAHGIFMDDCTAGITIQDNTVFGCNGTGLALHGVNNVKVLRNVSFNNQLGQLSLYTYSGECLPRDNVIQNNKFVGRNSTQPVVLFLSSQDDLPAYGAIDHNYYARPFDDVLTIRTVYNGNVVANLSLSQWQDKFQHDLFSHTSPLRYTGYTLQNLNTSSRIADSFDQAVNGWESWSLRGNGLVGWDKNSPLDGGSLRMTFSPPSPARDSYLLLYKSMQAVAKGKSYILRFDAITQGVDQRIDVYIRRRDAPYNDLTSRSTRLVTTGRQSYEIAFTATDSESDALLAFQLQENGQPIWLDNMSVQEATVNAVEQGAYMQLLNNPGLRDSTFTLAGNARDLQNRAYTGQVTLSPFQSVVLLRDTLPAVDVSLAMQLAKATVPIDEPAVVSVRLRSGAGAVSRVANRVQWACRLPAGLTLLDAQGLVWRDSTVMGTVRKLDRDTTFTFRVRATQTGTYQLAAQVTETAYADPNSSSDSGTDDNENDMARISFKVVTRGSLDTVSIVTAIEPTLPLTLNAVYPNPSSGGFTFVADGDLQQLRVFDLAGREHLHIGPTRREQPIRFGSELPTGQYVLRLIYSSGDARSVTLIKAQP
ncbi:right-handed parallel beta-helix repeat-containing protein [uncultured Spirosoma sp.]|uniref:right-handed parallel beta-helix repeat-containing protein n=1 Tax=uncultured Spirosoma sp. TaxID=278208 RepID=UPI0025909F07|nr:right-handed parallel beta-helix repeat-containing protein [uncultured Spirosoma sp.]